MTLYEFIAKYNGKYIDFDGMFGDQCFDLYRQYCGEYLEVPQSPPTGSLGAKEIWNNYLKDFFVAIPNSPLAVPQPGDIMIFGKPYGKYVDKTTGEVKYYGHVGIVWDANVMSYHLFEQNNPTDSPCHLAQHSYIGVLGWLRRKVEPEVVDTVPEAPQPAITEPEEKPVQDAPVASPEPISEPQQPESMPSSDSSNPEPQNENFQTLFSKILAWLKQILGV